MNAGLNCTVLYLSKVGRNIKDYADSTAASTGVLLISPSI